MKFLSQSQLKRLTAVHGWSGTILGILLYAVVLTGTVAVFGHEIATWSAGGHRVHAPLSGDVDGKVRPVLDSLTKGYLGEISIWDDAQGNLVMFPHAHARNPDTGQMDEYGPIFRIDNQTGDVLSRHDGFAYDRPDWYSASALEEFLVDLHAQLYIPQPWGLIVTGILGLCMMVAALSGLMMHRHMIRDLFVAARPGERLISARDRHILAGTWSLVFAFLLGFTGSFYSFAGTVTFPLLAQVAFGGDQEALIETLYEPKVAENATPTPFADLDAILAKAIDHTPGGVVLIDIARYGRADARVSIWQLPPDRGLGYVHNVFDGATGRFLGSRPIVGNTPSTGSDIYSLVAPLHFGHFAGVLSKSVWVGLGAAMCYVILSGMRLWVRRREGERLWRGFGRAVTVTSYGLPFAMLAAGHGFFLAGAQSGDPFLWTPVGFLIGTTLCIALGLVPIETDRLSRVFRGLLAVGCAALPMLRLYADGMGWLDAAAEGQGAVLSLDLTFLTLAGLLALWTLRAPAGQPVAEPAE